MSQALLASRAPVQRLALLECAPCAMLHALRQARVPPAALVKVGHSATTLWTPSTAAAAVDAAAAAVLLGGAAEVLVPASLVRFMEAHTATADGTPDSPLPHWAALREDNRLVVLVAAAGVGDLLRAYPSYRRLCIPVPGGPLSARQLFGQREDAFFGAALPQAVNAMATAPQSSGGAAVAWDAWVRSGLTCRDEGMFVPPIRIAERAAALLGGEMGCAQVVLEESVAGLTPRWLETIVKAASACGVPTTSMALALCDAPGVPRLLDKAAEMGITRFATCSLRGGVGGASGCLFDRAQALLGLNAAVRFAIGYSEVNRSSVQGGGLSAQEMDLLASSEEFTRALADEWDAVMTPASSEEC